MGSRVEHWQQNVFSEVRGVCDVCVCVRAWLHVCPEVGERACGLTHMLSRLLWPD